MIDVLLHSGLLNATFWAVALLFVAFLFFRGGRKVGLIPDLSKSLLLVSALGFGAVAAAGFGLYKGYVLPLDIMQDVVSAQESLAGRSLYPADMSERIQTTLDREPEPLSLSRWWPALREKEIQAREDARKLHWVQAHPPFMTMFFVPFVACLGVAGTFAAVSLLSLAALLGSLVLLRRGLELNLSGRQSAALALAVLGWAPVANVFRTGQVALLLCGLIVGAWYLLRRGRPALAGMAIGVATCLKLFPGLLLVYLLFRHRRAFASAALTIVVILGLTGAIAGWDVYREYYETGKGVVEEYGGFPNNLSLLGTVARNTGNLAFSQAVFLGFAFPIVGGLAWLVRPGVTRKERSREALDLEYSLFVALMPLLSPITWDHYLVVLLLPLAVLGRRVPNSGSKWAMVGFLASLVVLAIPDTTFFWLSPSIRQIGPVWDNAVFQSLRTAAVAALCLWLVWLIDRERFTVPTSTAAQEQNADSHVSVSRAATEPVRAIP